jgi:formylmethanofuran dehydrogenase subunit E-like metal-binding protein
MNTKRKIFTLALILAAMSGVVLAQSTIMEELGSIAAKEAMEQLRFDKGDSNILALTDAGYAQIKDLTTQEALSGITTETGVSEGNSNLFRVLQADNKPLWFFFFNKATGNAVYMQVDNNALNKSLDEFKSLSNDQIFSKISAANVDLSYMLNHTDEGNATFNKAAFNGNEFALVGISNIWAQPESTFDFLQAACFHDHLCPGVTGGYMLAKYVEKKLPLNNSSESYKVIAIPQWCKDDLLQLRWDATPGKSGMFVMALTDTEKNALNAKYNQTDVAGIYIRWNDTAKQGDALVLGFNWTKMYELTGTANWFGPSWATMLVMDIRMMDYWNRPEAVVSTLMEFNVDQNKLAMLQNAGMHPLKVAGIL